MSSILGANPLGFVTNESSLLNLDSIVLSEESSYLSETLKFIQECNREFDEANKGWYKSILESGNDQVVITESFHDFFVKVKGIIDKFIAFIKSLAERFITAIMSISKSDNYLKKHKDDFKKFSSKDEFDFDGYEFTFNPAVPVTDMVQAGFNQEFIELKVAQDGNIVDTSGATSTMKKIYDDLINKLENNFYDEFRKEVLALGYDITQADFANECFSAFRNNTSDKESIKINSQYIDAAYRRFSDYSDMKKNVETIKNRLTKEYEGVKKQILEISKTTYTGKVSTTNIELPNDQKLSKQLDSDAIKYLDLYVKAKADQVQEMSNIHAIAFSCKLDAMKASFVQDKTVLYKALSKCQRVHSEANYTDYTKEFEYASFLMESLESQKNMERYIQECCIISEGVNVVNRIQALNEGKLGDAFKKFIDWIKGLIAKFIEKLTGFAAKDTTYLEKYKNIILGKKFNPDDKFNMPDYFTGLQRIGKTAVPQFNYVSQEKLLAGENGEFAKSLINEYDPAKYDSFSAFCKDYFQGGSQENAKDYSGSEVGAHIRDIYDFCYDFKKIKDQITKDQNTLLSAAKKAEDVLANAARDSQSNTTSTTSQSTGTTQSSTTPTTTGQNTGGTANANASYVFSNVYGYVTEVDITQSDKSNNQQSSSTQTQGDASKKLSNNINNIADKDNEVNNGSDEAKAKAAEQDIKQITDNVKRYTDACGSLLTAKLTCIEKIRSDFMKIIRYHVGKYVGKADDKGDNRGAAAQGSDYKINKDQAVKIAKKVPEYKKASPETQTAIVNDLEKETKLNRKSLFVIFKKASKDNIIKTVDGDIIELTEDGYTIKDA